jgi:ATP-dependent Lon protease
MAKKESKRDRLAKVHNSLASQQQQCNVQIERAIQWMGTVPALPCNESRQVIKHLLAIIDASNRGDFENVDLEEARARKHIVMSIVDCLSVLHQAHIAVLENLIKNIGDDEKSSEVKVNKAKQIEEALSRAKLLEGEIGPLPSEEQRETAEQCEKDINAIRKAIIDYLDGVRTLEQQYKLFRDIFEDPKKMSDIIAAHRPHHRVAIEP